MFTYVCVCLYVNNILNHFHLISNDLPLLISTVTHAHCINLQVHDISQSFNCNHKSQSSVTDVCVHVCVWLPVTVFVYRTCACVVMREFMSNCLRMCVWETAIPACLSVVFFWICVSLWQIQSSSSIMKHNMVIQNPQVCVCVFCVDAYWSVYVCLCI